MVRTNVYVPRWLIEKARARRLNVSRLVTEALKAAMAEPSQSLNDRIRMAESELRALQAESLAASASHWELDRIRAAAGWRFHPNQSGPSRAFCSWWASDAVRADYPQNAALDARTVWEKLNGGGA